MYNENFLFMIISFLEHLTEKKINELESMENDFLQLIRNGDVDSIEEWLALNPVVNHCQDLTEDALRDVKNSFIIMATTASKAASDGGLDRMITLEMQLKYISLLEEITAIEDVFALQAKMILEFTRSCRNAKSITVQSKLVNDTIRYIQHHLSEPIRVNDIADSLKVSRGHLSSVFHEEMGMTLSDYIRKTKVEEAQTLLKKTSLSLASISEKLGFSSQGHLTHVFKQVTGTTPNKYRNGQVS